MLIQKEEEIDKLRASKQSNIHVSPNKSDGALLNLDEQSNLSGPNMNNGDKLDKDYIKNILFKYLEYQVAGELKQALTLEKVLFTVLQANELDI